MLNTTPLRLRFARRAALLLPSYRQIQPRIVHRRATGAVAGRLSQASQWRAVHSTRAGFSPHKTPGPEMVNVKLVNNYFGLLTIGCVAYVACKEIPYHLPARTNPKFLMKESLEIVQKNDEVTAHLGTPLTGTGDDSVWDRVENVTTQQPQDGQPSRLLIKYYLSGPNGSASVFAEVTKGSAEGEYNYLIVKFDDTNEVVMVIDNREAVGQ